MTNLQKSLIELIDAFSELCDSADVCWCVCDRLAWLAYKHHRFVDTTSDAFAMVKQVDVEKLVQQVSTPGFEGYELSVSQNPDKLMGYFASKNEVHFNVANFGATNPHLGITLRLLREDSNGEYVTFSPKGKEIRFATDLTQTDEFRLFEGRILPIPANCDAYFTAIEGPQWRTRTYTGPISKDSLGCFQAQALSFDEIVEQLGEKGYETHTINAAMSEYREFRSGVFRPADAAVAENNVALRVNTQRIRLCHKYLPHKQFLINQWERGNTHFVAKALADDYCKELKRFYPNRITLHFDDDLFDLAIEVLRQENWKHADELSRMVPEEHRSYPLADIMAPYFNCR